MDKSRDVLDTITGLAAVGCGLVGIAAFIVAVFAFSNTQYTGAGLSLIAAALAFGQLMNITSRG